MLQKKSLSSLTTDDRRKKHVVRRTASVPASLCATRPSSKTMDEDNHSSSTKRRKFSMTMTMNKLPFLKNILRSASGSSTNSGGSLSDVEESTDDNNSDIENENSIKEAGQDVNADDEYTSTPWTGVHPIVPTQTHRALQIPEILRTIFQFVDDDNTVPHEQAPKRRSPMSLRHALLLYGDNPSARQVWKDTQLAKRQSYGNLADGIDCAGLYSCLLVNPQWYEIASDVLLSKLHFSSTPKWKSFVNQAQLPNTANTRAQLLVLHKVDARQSEIDTLAPTAGNLSWLEFYTCPDIVPTRSLLSGGRLTKIVLPGCCRVDDRVVKLVSECCPQVQTLDLRACEQVSDRGLKYLAKSCPQLRLLNVGRTRCGEFVTHRSIKHVVRRCRKLDTLGLAGCFIDDRTVWEVALRLGHVIERLSLNNCEALTNASIPRVLGYTKRLSVLELRNCVQITEMKLIVLFKKYRQRIGRPPLIEGCEAFELRMKEAEWLVEMEWSRQVFKDCLEWIYAEDGDVTMEHAGLSPPNANANDDDKIVY